MSIFEHFFGKKDDATASDSKISFGRFSDSYKQTRQYDAWDLALEKFENEDYLESYIAFLDYLNDETEENVKYHQHDGRLEFEILQGSKKISGTADRKKIRVEARIATALSLNIDFMQRLIEQNFGLNYSRFGLDIENNITIVFDSFVLDASPYKLYYAIRELAINADKFDDLLIDEFEELQAIETNHLADLPPEEKEAKYQFITNKIDETLSEIKNGKLDPNEYPAGVAYQLLDLCYKLDYLTRPEGFLMEALERMNRLYFAKDNQTAVAKNEMLQKELELLRLRSKEEYFKEMYRVKTTFGITNPVNHDRLCGLIDEVLHDMDWYKENGCDKVALAIAGYIVGNALFNFAVPEPVKDLYTLYYRVAEPEYFQKLSFEPAFYNEQQKRLNKKAIKNAIKEIATQHRKKYPDLYPDLKKLNFKNRVDFANSYLLMVKKLGLNRVE